MSFFDAFFNRTNRWLAIGIVLALLSTIYCFGNITFQMGDGLGISNKFAISVIQLEVVLGALITLSIVTYLRIRKG